MSKDESSADLPEQTSEKQTEQTPEQEPEREEALEHLKESMAEEYDRRLFFCRNFNKNIPRKIGWTMIAGQFFGSSLKVNTFILCFIWLFLLILAIPLGQQAYLDMPCFNGCWTEAGEGTVESVIDPMDEVRKIIDPSEAAKKRYEIASFITIKFRFSPAIGVNGESIHGRCFLPRNTQNRQLRFQCQPEKSVPIEIWRGNPQISRIKGTYYAHSDSLFILAISLIFLIPLLTVVAYRWQEKWNLIRLLRKGQCALGYFMEYEEITKKGKKTLKQPLYNLRFAYKDDDNMIETISLVTDDHTAFTAPPALMVFYDPENSLNAIIYEAIPGEINYNADAGKFSQSKWCLLGFLAPVILIVSYFVGIYISGQ